MDHLEAIVEIKSVINPDIIEKTMSLIDAKAIKNLSIRGNVVNKNVRNVKGYHLNFKTPTNMFYFNYLKKEIERLYKFYKVKFPKFASNKISQIDLLKYLPGGKYEIHTDHYSSTPRHLSIIMNLNNNYKGGDLIFTDQKEKEIKRLKLDQGSIVFFPSNFMYPHIIEPITKGIRYSVVAWLK